jgi:hypothetical protein
MGSNPAVSTFLKETLLITIPQRGFDSWNQEINRHEWSAVPMDKLLQAGLEK